MLDKEYREIVNQLKDLVVKEKQAINYPHRTRKIAYSQEVHSLVRRALCLRGVNPRLLAGETGLSKSLIEKQRRKNPQRQFRELALTPHNGSNVHANSEKQPQQNSENSENFGRFEFALPFGLRVLLEQKNKNRDISIVLRTEG